MHDIRKINVMEGILDENDHIAEHVNEHMTSHGVLVVNEMGAPGVGKTTSLKNIVKHLDVKPYVIEGDIESDIDTQDLNSLGIETHQVNTHGECHLDAPLIEHATEHISFSEPGILFIENIGNLVCPAEFTIGEHVMMLISTVTEGSDKPYKYPLAFEKADIILLNKVDTLPVFDFDMPLFEEHISDLNPQAPLFKIAATKEDGVAEWAAWLTEQIEATKAKRA